MKQKAKKSLLICMFWLFVLALPLQVQAASAKASIRLSKSSVTIYTGASTTLKATVTGKSKKVTWKSSKPSVATVSSSGKVTAVKAGKTTITAKANKKTVKCVVTVKKAPTIDLKKYLQGGVGSATKTQLKKAVKKIVGVKAKSSSVYPDLYYTGKKMTIGLNLNAEYGTKAKNYIYIKNTGNKKVKYYGVQIGDSKSAVAAKMKNAGMRTYNNGKVYWWGNAAYVKLTYKNGKVSAYTYVCAPTSP